MSGTRLTAINSTNLLVCRLLNSLFDDKVPFYVNAIHPLEKECIGDCFISLDQVICLNDFTDKEQFFFIHCSRNIHAAELIIIKRKPKKKLFP